VLNLPWRVWEGQETLWELEKTLDNAKGASGNQACGAQAEDGIAEHNADDAATTRDEGLGCSGDPAHEESEPRCEPSTSRSREMCPSPIPEADGAIALASARKWYETQVECAICLEEFVPGDKVRVLPCRHIFHMGELSPEVRSLTTLSDIGFTCPRGSRRLADPAKETGSCFFSCYAALDLLLFIYPAPFL
jgi:hypothetical protein